jgi:hypothetical protein
MTKVGIVLGWLLVNGLLFIRYGIVTTGEAGKYILEARYLVDTGHIASHNFIFYSVIIVLLSACIKLHIGFGWVIAIQGALSLAATLSFHKTLQTLLRSPAAALIATALLLVNLPYQAFNCFLQTESLFFSVSLLLMCSLLRQKTYSNKFGLALMAALLLLSLIRPTGLLYWPLAGIYGGSIALKNRPVKIKLATAALAAVCALLLINFAMNTGGEFDFTLPFREEHIICGAPTLLTPHPIPTTGTGNSLFALLYYVTHDFGNFIRLAGLKTLSFWTIYRKYYSAGHNGYLAILFYPIIIGAFLSFQTWRRRNQLLPFIYLATPIAMTYGTVVLTCDDWSNRFFLSISPFLLLLAARLIPGFMQRQISSSERISTR